MNGKYKTMAFLWIALFVLGISANSLQAAIKDTDVDGLSDEAEINIYHTNPLVFDTDGDGRGDGDEVLDGTNPLDKGSSWIAEVSGKDTGLLGNPKQFAWYLGQASGILVFVLLTAAVIFGLVLSAFAYTKFVPGTAVYEAQRFIFWIALGTIILHFIGYYFDDILNMKAVRGLVPPTLFREVGATPDAGIVTAVAFCIITFYFLFSLIFTSKIHSKISPEVWRVIRYVAFIAYLLFALHSLIDGAGSQGWGMKMLYAVSLGIVLLLVSVRIILRNILPIWRARREKELIGTDVHYD